MFKWLRKPWPDISVHLFTWSTNKNTNQSKAKGLRSVRSPSLGRKLSPSMEALKEGQGWGMMVFAAQAPPEMEGKWAWFPLNSSCSTITVLLCSLSIPRPPIHRPTSQGLMLLLCSWFARKQRWANNSVFEYYSNNIRIPKYSYSYLVDIFKPNNIRIRIRVIFSNRIIFVFVFGWFFQTE